MSAYREGPGSAPDDPLGHVPEPVPRPSERFPWTYLLIFLVGTALVASLMWHHIQSQRTSIHAHWQSEISEIANDRGRLVGNWLDARRADAEVLAGSPSVRALLSAPRRTDEALVRQLDRVVAAYGYVNIAVFDKDGRAVALSSGATDLGPSATDIARAVARARRFRIELGEEKPDQRLLTVSVPVFPDAGPSAPAVLGVVTVRMRAEAGLFPLLADETSTRNGETLLFRLDTRDEGYLSPFRHVPAGSAAVSQSLAALQDLARSVADSRVAFGEVTDYRGVPVFTAVRLVPRTGWALALKVDRDEALAQFSRAEQLAGATAAFSLLALAGFLIALWRQQQRTYLLRAQIGQERAIFNLKGYAEKIVASVPSGLLLLSADLRILSVNPSFLESFGFREDDVIGHGLSDVVRAEGLIRRAQEVLRSGIAQHDVLFDLHVRQETRPVVITMTGIRMAGEEQARLLLIIQDLTEEERLHAARRASEDRFRDLVQGLDAIVWEADAASLKFSFVSQRAETILGHPVERWLTSSDFFVTRIHPDDRARTIAVCRDAIVKGLDHELEYRALAADGREVWLRDIVHVVPASDGRPVQLRGLTVDVTERKRAEEALRQTEDQLRQAQKMDAVGKLAGGIAHDFNNLLMVIRGDADLILRRLETGNPLRQNTEGIREAADQAAALTRQLLAFSRKQVLAPAVLDVNTVVAGIQKMLRRLIGETINLVTATASDVWRVRADPGQLEQMIVNLAVNARDAMPDGGRLTIRTSNAELDAATARQRGVKPGAYVLLEVSDTGVGMDAETQAHVFEPFFTTKDQGKGTGLGLSTVYGIVNQSGGHIWVDSEPGHGTTIRVYLPRVEEIKSALPAPGVVPRAEPRLAEPVAASHSATREVDGTGNGRKTVLLVEDAKRVREVVREILEMNGYAVLEARQGAEALKISTRHEGPIDLMVTDVVMPQMSGRELAQRLAPLRPDMRVLYMSGYTDDDIVKHGVLGAGMAFISKPFTPDALAAKVRAVLDTMPRPVAPASADPENHTVKAPPARDESMPRRSRV